MTEKNKLYTSTLILFHGLQDDVIIIVHLDAYVKEIVLIKLEWNT